MRRGRRIKKKKRERGVSIQAWWARAAVSAVLEPKAENQQAQPSLGYRVN